MAKEHSAGQSSPETSWLVKQVQQKSSGQPLGTMLMPDSAMSAALAAGHPDHGCLSCLLSCSGQSLHLSMAELHVGVPQDSANPTLHPPYVTSIAWVAFPNAMVSLLKMRCAVNYRFLHLGKWHPCWSLRP